MTGVLRLQRPMPPSLHTTACDASVSGFSTRKRLIQKTSGSPRAMKSRAWLVVVLFLLVSTPLTGAVEPVASKDFISASDGVNAPAIEPLTEAQRLVIAKEHWSPMPAATMFESSLKPSSGLVHQAAGSFDPLLSMGPTLPGELTRAEDMAHTGLVIVQLNTPNGDLMQSIAEDLGLTVLDASGDEAWLLRLPESPD